MHLFSQLSRDCNNKCGWMSHSVSVLVFFAYSFVLAHVHPVLGNSPLPILASLAGCSVNVCIFILNISMLFACELGEKGLAFT